VPLLVAQDVLQLPAEHVLVFHRDQPPARAQRADWRNVGGLRSRQGLPTPPVPALPPAPRLPDVLDGEPDAGQVVLDVDET
jgi:type IV secretory pathway TraG/TraD family ATPase VirD4